MEFNKKLEALNEEKKQAEEKYQELANQKASTLMKIYVDKEGYVTFPDGSRYKGGLQSGIPEGEGRIIYTDGSVYDGEWRSGNSHGHGTL